MLELTFALEGLGTDNPMTGGEVDRLSPVLFPPDSRFKRQNVRRVTHDLCAASRGDDAVLVYECHPGTGGQGRKRREVYPVKVGGKHLPQPRLDPPQLARITGRRPHVTVVGPALHKPGRLHRRRSDSAQFHEEGVQVAGIEIALESRAGLGVHAGPHPLDGTLRTPIHDGDATRRRPTRSVANVGSRA